MLNTSRKLLPRLAALALAFSAASSVHALAGSDSLKGWTALGDVVAQGGTLSMTTAYVDGIADEPGNLSGQAALWIDALENGAGLAFGTLNLSDSHNAVEGSLLQQSFAVAAGQTLSFSWSFGSADTQQLDHAFAVINGQLFTLATTAQPGGAGQSFSYTFGQSGTASFALGVVDTVGVDGVSRLNVSGLQISAVPEPGSWALMLAGLGTVGALVRRRRQRG